VREALETLWHLASRIPACCAARGPFFKHCEAVAERLAPLQDDRLVLGLPECGRESLMTTLCHIAAGCMVVSGTERAPRCIDKPLRAVARSVGRPPRLDFTELVLTNWYILPDGACHRNAQQASGTIAAVVQTTGDHEAAAGRETSTSKQLPPHEHNKTVRWHFLASPDEQWYRDLHCYLHGEAREVVAAIRVGQVGMRDQSDQAVVGSLVKMVLWLSTTCDCFDMYFEQKDSRTESMMFRRLEPFIDRDSKKRLSREEMACWVFISGSSVLLPALHAFLGVKMGVARVGASSTASDPPTEAQRLGESLAAQMEEMRMFMPRMHRAFLEELERPGANVRHYCFRRFGGRAISVEQLHDLEVAYNDAINALLRFLMQRVHLVTRFFPQLGTVLAALHADLEASMQSSRLQLLRMRQRVDRCLEPLH